MKVLNFLFVVIVTTLLVGTLLFSEEDTWKGSGIEGVAWRNGRVGIGLTDPDPAIRLVVGGVLDPAIKLKSTDGSTGFIQILHGNGGVRLYDGKDYTMHWKDGRVGIGLTDPDPAIRLVVGGVLDPAIKLKSTDGSTGFIQTLHGNGGVRLYDGKDYTMHWKDGKVGIGTARPSDTKLVIDKGSDSRGGILDLNSNNMNIGHYITFKEKNDAKWEIGHIGSRSSGGDDFVIRSALFPAPAPLKDVVIFKRDGNVGIGIRPTHLLHLRHGAYCDGGAWIPSCSREYKENIISLKLDEALEAMEGLNPVKFNYKTNKEEDYIGFIAEDVPELVATRERKGVSPMDVVAVLTKVVQEQQRAITELNKRIAELEKKSQ